MRKIIATFLFFTAGLLASPPARAQSFSVGYTCYPYSRLEQVSGTPSPNSPTHIRVNTLQAMISYPLEFNQGRTRLENTIVYNYLKFDYRGAPSLLESVQSYSYTAFFTHDFLNGLGIIAVVTPGFADDFHGPATSDAITMSMALAGSYKFSEDFKVGLGVAIDTNFGEDVLLPATWAYAGSFFPGYTCPSTAAPPSTAGTNSPTGASHSPSTIQATVFSSRSTWA